MKDKTECEDEDLFGDFFPPSEGKKYQYTILTRIKNETITFTSLLSPIEVISYFQFHRNFAIIGNDSGLWIRKKDVLMLRCINPNEGEKDTQNKSEKKGQ